MKTLLIVILLNSNSCPMTAEFNDAGSCEDAATAVRQAANAKTICAPKGATGQPKLQDRLGIK